MPQLPRRIVIVQTAALLAVLAVVIPTEIEHWRTSQLPGENWFIGIYDTTIPLLLILALPYFWCVRRPFLSLENRWWQQLAEWWTERPESGRERASRRGLVVAGLLIAGTSLWMSLSVDRLPVGDHEQFRFGELPPAYHDEFSYLVQAKTYLAGRLSFESHPTAARLFDQMHVVNEGRFASRYFPATGLWIAPWLWGGWPIVGHWLAGAATCVLVFGIGRELSNNGTGFIAGMLVALSPGMALFGNLLLAHHPTLLGLFVFAWSFLRWVRRGFVRDVVLASIGLSWAMLCRPMTAAGFGLPFGAVFVWKLWTLTRSASEGERSRELPSPRPRWRFGFVCRPLLAMTLPLVAGFLVLAIHNRAITGSAMISPYQLFTEIYTPRHVFGFNNVVRGEQHLGPRVLDRYDRWAVNLTPALAIENTKNRLLASWQWTVGLIPLLASVIVFVVGHVSNVPSSSDVNQPTDGRIGNVPHGRDRRWWLIFAAIVSLFTVHVPYWFDGIFHWHYVFETGPLWCLLLAAATDTLARSWLAAERSRMPVWWSLLVASAVAVNVTDCPPFWFPSKVEAGASEIAFSRLKYQAFDELLRRDVRERPALVLIEADPTDRHIDYVVNEPSLTASVLRARWPVPDWTLERVQAVFPDRTVYLFQAKTGELKRIARP